MKGNYQCFGVDISHKAVDVAREKSVELGLSIDYSIMDACSLKFADDTFSHILGGCNFAFINNRRKALQEVYRVLEKGGKLLTANFYYTKSPSTALLDAVQNVIGFRPSPTWDYEFWCNFFGTSFKLQYEQNKNLQVLSPVVLKDIVRQNIINAKLDLTPIQIDKYIARLYEIRSVLNEHRAFQNYVVQIWQKV